MHGLRALLGTLVVAAMLAVATTASAADTGSTRSLTRLETLMLGPEHATEHAGLRMIARSAERAWRRMTPAQRRRQVRIANDRVRKLARASDTLDPAIYGKWTTGPFRIPVAAIHASLLPTGKVLFFAFPFYPENNPPYDATTTGDAWVWDPSKTPDTSTTADPSNEPDVFTHVPPPYDPETGGTASLFCAGLSLLANGDVFVTGGTLKFPNPTSPYHYGLKRAYTFNPWTETWIQQPDMQHGRWYPSHVELPDGRVAVLAGTDENGTADNSQLEVFNPTEDASGVGTWSYFPQGNRTTDLYPHMILLGDGKVLLEGPGDADTGILNPSSMTWSSAPARLPVGGARRTYGTELLNPNGTGPSMSITEIGGFPSREPPGQTNYPPTNTSQTLDLSLNPPQWTSGPSLNVARANHNTLWLPDGTELTIGGGNGSVNGSTYVLAPGSPEKQIELLDPATGQWRLGPAQQIPRAYHSTAMLLPDGRVLSAGDDNPYVYGKPYEGSDHNSGEIYSPPYLFRGPRPQITAAPTGSLYNARFHVSLSNVDTTQAQAVLIPPAAVTHSTNPNPRIVPLASAPTSDGLNLTAPANADIAPPGWYMLFVVNSDGVPSVASWVRIGYADGSGGGDLPPEISPPSSPPPVTTQPGGTPAPAPVIRHAVEWVKVATHQSFTKGYVVAYIGLGQNNATVTASLRLASAHGSRTRTLLGRALLRGQRAGTMKLVVRLSASALRQLRAMRHPSVVLRLQVSAPGLPAYGTQQRITAKR